MVTKRARRWVQRGVMASIVIVVLGLALATWFTSEAIETDLLLIAGGESTDDPGDADSWAVFVHGKDAGREQALDLLPTFAEQGLTSLVISYRGDGGAPPAEGGHHALGADEWEDLEAAVVFAIESGAGDVVLVGHGSGGAIALTFLRESVWAEQAAGVVLDSAYLDPGSMVDHRTATDNVPGFLSGWGKALATFRFGVDWATLDQLAAAEEFNAPILLIHGAGDEQVPVRTADAFAAALPELVRYVRIAGAGHLEGFTVDLDRYTGAVGEFLLTVAVDPPDEPEIVPRPGQA